MPLAVFAPCGRWLGRHPFFLGAASTGISGALTLLVMGSVFHNFHGWPGSEGYARIAWNVAHHGLFSSNGSAPTTERMPLYPLILAAVMQLTGAAWQWWAAGLNALALAACGGLATSLCCRLYANQQAAWACALVLALHITWNIEALAYRETVWFALAILGLAAALTTARIGPARLLLAGSLAAAAYLLRPTGFLVVAILPCWLWATRRAFLPRFALPVGCALGIAALAVASWQLYAVRTTGHLQLSDSEGGNTALKGAIPEFWVVEPWVDLDLLDPLVTAQAEFAGATTPDERDHYWRMQAARIVCAAPGHWLAKAALKVAALISPVSTPFGYGSVVADGNSLKLINFRWDPWAFASVPSVLLVLGGAAWRMRQWRTLPSLERPLVKISALLLALVCILHAATSGETRYRLPLDPLLAVLAVPAIAKCWTALVRHFFHQEKP